ncbi:helix-turn-helix transcriptional regulator [Microseira wollei]|uniref:Transcriptional regulator n=1 Tax=Microseira wollei NIES-4236 TaxID=2530354 RepID=A0AAV3XTT3_9CYAN|nr:metalloregulator ArsR/SmtB family transcription factor [Microseira wollei]GET44422.1 transcriptional regulator [Microseira wollei NIES-4236]
MEGQQRSKNQILYLLKTRGDKSAIALAEELHLSPMAVRQHLQALQSEGLVSYREEKRPLGRPVKLWRLTDRAAAIFPDSHADLMVDLLQSVEAVFGAPGLEKLIAERSQRQIQAYTEKISDAEDWRSRVYAIARLRTREGYMAEAIELPERGMLLIENHCPIRAAAASCGLLCKAELEVFKTLLGATVKIERVEHILASDRRCAYRICPVETAVNQC